MLRAYNSSHFNSELNAKKKAGQSATACEAFPTIAMTALAAGMKVPTISHVDMPVIAHESEAIAHTDFGAESREVVVEINDKMKIAPMDKHTEMMNSLWAPLDKHMEMMKSYANSFFQRAPSMFRPFDFPAFSPMVFPSFTPSRCPVFDPLFTSSFTPFFTHSFDTSLERFFDLPRIENSAFCKNIPTKMKGTVYDMSNEEDRSAAQEKCKELGLAVPSTRTKNFVIGVENGTSFVREEGENFKATHLRHEEKSNDKKSYLSIQQKHSYNYSKNPGKVTDKDSTVKDGSVDDSTNVKATKQKSADKSTKSKKVKKSVASVKKDESVSSVKKDES